MLLFRRSNQCFFAGAGGGVTSDIPTIRLPLVRDTSFLADELLNPSSPTQNVEMLELTPIALQRRLFRYALYRG